VSIIESAIILKCNDLRMGAPHAKQRPDQLAAVDHNCYAIMGKSSPRTSAGHAHQEPQEKSKKDYLRSTNRK